MHIKFWVLEGTLRGQSVILGVSVVSAESKMVCVNRLYFFRLLFLPKVMFWVFNIVDRTVCQIILLIPEERHLHVARSVC